MDCSTSTNLWNVRVQDLQCQLDRSDAHRIGHSCVGITVDYVIQSPYNNWQVLYDEQGELMREGTWSKGLHCSGFNHRLLIWAESPLCCLSPARLRVFDTWTNRSEVVPLMLCEPAAVVIRNLKLLELGESTIVHDRQTKSTYQVKWTGAGPWVQSPLKLLPALDLEAAGFGHAVVDEGRTIASISCDDFYNTYELRFHDLVTGVTLGNVPLHGVHNSGCCQVLASVFHSDALYWIKTCNRQRWPQAHLMVSNYHSPGAGRLQRQVSLPAHAELISARLWEMTCAILFGWPTTHLHFSSTRWTVAC